MLPQKSGKIINIASATSRIGLARRISYAASKGGVVQLTRALAAEWAPHGICVNAIAPGFFHTEINDELFRDPHWRENLVSRIVAGRPGVPGDLAGAAIFLASARVRLRHGSRPLCRRRIHHLRHHLIAGGKA